MQKLSSQYFRFIGLLVFATLAGWLFGPVPDASAQKVPQIIYGTVPAAITNYDLKAIGTLPISSNLNFAICLPLADKGALPAFLRDLYDPHSPNYRQFMTPAEFTARFGPSEADYQALIEFAMAQGFTITATHSNRIVLSVSGPVEKIQTAFGVVMNTYPHPTEKREFFAPSANPSVLLATPILSMSGLNNYSLPHPKLTTGGDGLGPKVGTGPGGSYMGDDFRTAYAPGVLLDGTGQSVGLLQFDGYDPTDIYHYAATAGRTNVPLQNVLIDGATGQPSGTGGEGEVCLDIEMILAMAPNIQTIYVYMAPNPSPWVDLLSRMANDNSAKQLSCSWGGGGPDPAAEIIFQQMAAQGQSFFNASGDSDAFRGNNNYPGFPTGSTNITQVGGTTLTTTNAGGAYVSETVWNWGGGVGSSGGITPADYPIPAYQADLNMTLNGGSTTLRNVPDVALTADNIYVYADGQNQSVGGTSAAAPLWAAFTALVNQQAAANSVPPVGFVNPALYTIGQSVTYDACFHDITTGNNANGAGLSFNAVVGYDLATGWGTPNGIALINALAGAQQVAGQACVPTTVSAGTAGQPCATRNAGWWFSNAYSTNVNAATLERAIIANGGTMCVGFLSLPVTYENADSALDSTDTLMETLGFYWRSAAVIGPNRNRQSAKMPASPLCKARKKLAVELVAAIANNALLGATPGVCTNALNFPPNIIEQAGAVAAGEDVQAIKAMTSVLRQFNYSGVKNPLPDNLLQETQNTAKSLRNISRDPTSHSGCPGINDECASATAVIFPRNTNTTGRAVYTASVSLENFTGSFGNTNSTRGGCVVSPVAYWKITPNVGVAGRQFTVDTTGSNFDTAVSVYSGTSCFVLNFVACNDNDVQHAPASKVTFTTDGVNNYYILAGGANGTPGKLKLKITSF